MGRLEAFTKLIKSKFYLVALIFVAISFAFYSGSNSDKSSYASIELPIALAEQISATDLSLEDQWQEPDFVKATLSKVETAIGGDADSGTEAGIGDWKAFLAGIKFESSNKSFKVALPNYRFDIGSRILENQLSTLVSQNAEAIKKRQNQEVSKVKDRLSRTQEQLDSWALELKSAEESLLKNKLAVEIAELQKLATTFAVKHPKVQEALSSIKIKYAQIGRKVPDFQALLREHSLPSSNNTVTPEMILNLKNKITEANNTKLALEAELTMIDKQNYQLQMPKAKLVTISVWKLLFFKVFLPSVLMLLIFLAIAYRIFRYRDPVPSATDLKSAIKIEKVYSFPKIDLIKDSSHLQKNPVSGNLLLIGQTGTLKDKSNLPAVINKNFLPVPILSNNQKNQESQNEISELAVKIMINAKADHKQILFFSAPEQNQDQAVVVSNLAVAMARYSSKVLMLDASFGNPQLSRHFNIEQEETGFSDFLNRTQRVDLCLHPTWLDNLQIMPIGKEQEEAQRLLLKPRFTQALKTLVNRFDYILISAGSLSSDVSSQLVASNSDLIFLVADSQSNTLAVIQQALLRLSDINLQPEALILQRTRI